MKERLIELFSKFQFVCVQGCGRKYEDADNCNKCAYGQLADYLIENGAIVPSEDYAKIVRCSECENLNVIGTKELYARCEKYGFEFLPFKADTRNHFCVQYK